MFFELVTFDQIPKTDKNTKSEQGLGFSWDEIDNHEKIHTFTALKNCSSVVHWRQFQRSTCCDTANVLKMTLMVMSISLSKSCISAALLT